MNISLLGQGFEATSQNSAGNKLIKFFADKDFHTFTGITAFASQAGIRGLSKHIKTAKKHLNIITIATGIDQKGTSKEALEELLALNIDAYVFYQPSITIFHPKIYLFEGADKSELIIGSSNLTSQGLFTNVEASLLVSIDNRVETDRKIVEQLKDYFKGIFDFTDPNLKKLSKKIIADLVKAKVVPTEAERKAAQDKAEKAVRKETEIIISKIFPKRAIAKIPSEFRGTKKQQQNQPLLPLRLLAVLLLEESWFGQERNFLLQVFRLADQGLILQVDFVWFRTILYQEEARLTKQAISKICLANTPGNKFEQLLMLKPPKFLLKLLLRVSFTDALTLKCDISQVVKQDSIITQLPFRGVLLAIL